MTLITSLTLVTFYYCILIIKLVPLICGTRDNTKAKIKNPIENKSEYSYYKFFIGT